MAPRTIAPTNPTARERSRCNASAFIPVIDEPEPKAEALELKGEPRVAALKLNADLGLQVAALPAVDQAMVPRLVDVKEEINEDYGDHLRAARASKRECMNPLEVSRMLSMLKK